MPSLKQIRNRIKSVENTKKITRAMEMVAAAKLRRFEDSLKKVQTSQEFLRSLLNHLQSEAQDLDHPFFQVREEKKNIAVLLVTSDAGLCGTYNSNVIAEARRFFNSYPESTLHWIPVGKTGLLKLQSEEATIPLSFQDLRFQNWEAFAKNIIDHTSSLFLDGSYDEVHVIYTRYVSKSDFYPVHEKLLSFSLDTEDTETDQDAHSDSAGYIFEPDAKTIFQALIPQYLTNKVCSVLLEGALSEQISRMLAMHQATQNAKEMVENLTLLRNKMRQASITQELMEVVSGAQVISG